MPKKVLLLELVGTAGLLTAGALVLPAYFPASTFFPCRHFLRVGDGSFERRRFKRPR
jgi:hypothetical protein